MATLLNYTHRCPLSKEILNSKETQSLDQILSHLDIHDHWYGRLTNRSVKIGCWTITTEQDVEKDNSYYSKGWHRKYGAKFTVYNRQVTFTRKHGRGTLKKTFPVKLWSGNYLSAAIVALGLAPKKPLSPLSVRLNKAFDAKLIKCVRGYKIYSRTLLGEHVDYVIKAPLGTTFHSSSKANLFRGLFKKIRAAKTDKNIDGSKVSWKICKELGFCDAGIKGFCADFNLNPKEEYSPYHLAEVVKNNLSLAEPYLPELEILAKTYNYDIVDFQ